MNDSHLIIAGLLAAGAIVAAGYDLKVRRIPNWLNVAIVLSGLVLHSATAGGRGIVFSLFGMVAGAGLLFLPYVLGGMGAGDLKLMAAIGAVVGAKGILAVFVISAMFGGALAIAALLLRDRVAHSSNRFLRMILGTFPSAQTPRFRLPGQRVMVPYGVAISCGALTMAGILL
ncbi:MAG: prepilin peptidase [Acidobacteria bacterium]|nr:prepilin peptidase [Acidobacteriota bacterium]